MNKKRIIFLSVILLIIAIALITTFLAINSDKESEVKEKTITISVDYGEGTKDKFTLTTMQNTLGDVLVSEKIVEGEKGQYGLFITSVKGIKADEKKQQWWKVTKNGEMLYTGISTTGINDGDSFELSLITGYETYSPAEE